MAESARILVVDDEEPVCKTVASALAGEEHTVDTALSAEDALLKAEAARYDVVITDLMMPGLSGMDLLKIVAEKMPDTKVIMITGFPSVKSAVEAMRLGAFDFIPKPFTPKELRSLVSRALASKRYRDKGEVSPPAGLHCIPENSWATLDGDKVRVGIHHVFLKTIPDVTSIRLPAQGEVRYQGEACVEVTDFTGHVHKVWAPVSGRIIEVNDRVIGDYSALLNDPYGEGWVFLVSPTDLEDDLKNLVGPETTILSVMNGLDSEQTLGSIYGMDKVLYTIAIGIDAVREGNQITFSRPGKLYFGEASNTPISPRVHRVEAILDRAGIAHETPPDMIRMLWWKFMINVGVNQASAVMRAPYGAFQSIPQAQALSADLMREVLALARAEGVNLVEQDMDDWYRFLSTLSPQGKTSMLQDIEAGRKTEVEMFGGKVVELGHIHGIPTPVNETVLRIIQVLER